MADLSHLRFLLPRLPRTAIVQNDEWRAAFAGSGLELVEPSANADLVVASATDLKAARATGAPNALVIGRARGRHGVDHLPYLVRPDETRPQVAIPLASGRALAHVARSTPVRSARGRLRRSVASSIARFAARTILKGNVHVFSGDGTTPALVKEAQRVIDRPIGDWSLHLRSGPAVRSAMLLFDQRSREPEWALKFATDPRLVEPFVEEERSLAIVSSFASEVADHVPRHLGRFTVEGYQASVETAATGADLRATLRAAGDRSSKLATVERVAEWIRTLGRTSRTSAESLEPQRARLANEVLPRWEVDRALVDSLGPLAGVAQHNDLTPHNVIVTASSFVVIDWSLLETSGFPLWDLLIFLTAAFADLDGAATNADLDRHLADLFLGRAPSSEVFFRHLREAAAESGVAPEEVGKVTTLAWLEYAHRRRRYEERVGAGTDDHLYERRAASWLSTPGLGPGWTFPG